MTGAVPFYAKRRIFKTYVVYTIYNIYREIFHVNKYFIFYKFIKLNIVTCMKVTGETFSLSKQESKEAEDARHHKYPNLAR